MLYGTKIIKSYADTLKSPLGQIKNKLATIIKEYKAETTALNKLTKYYITPFSLKNGTVKGLLEILCISNKPFSKNFVLAKTS